MLQLERFVPVLLRSAPHHPRRILVVNGHPDPRPERFCAALCARPIRMAPSPAGWEVRRLDVGKLDLSADHGK